jgi:Fur family ferric uptake transcriptional regulator
MVSTIEKKCLERGLRMTGQRRTIAQVISESQDHPDVEEIFRRAAALDPKISIATVYRTMRLLEETNVIEKRDFGDGRARYEEQRDEHHHHLIDLKSGEVIEFQDEELERRKREIADRLGYDMMGDRLEIYGIKKGAAKKPKT